MIYSRRKFFNLYFPFLLQMSYQLARIMAAEMSQTDIKAGILVFVANLVDQQTGLADGLIVGVDTGRRADSLNFKQIKGFEKAGYRGRDHLPG